MQHVIPLHLLAVVIWVGGMFFAYMALRPAAVATLEPPERLRLWVATFKRFFPWVWGAIATILASGFWVIFKIYGGMAHTPLFVHIMLGLGIVMMMIFLHVFFAPYRRLKQAVANENWPEGGKKLAQIRILVGINTLIGLITILIASAGRYFLA